MSCDYNTLSMQIGATSIGQLGFDLRNKEDVDVLRQVQVLAPKGKASETVQAILKEYTPSEVQQKYNDNQRLKERMENVLYGTSLCGIDLNDKAELAIVDQIKDLAEKEFGEDYIAPAVYGFILNYV